MSQERPLREKGIGYNKVGEEERKNFGGDSNSCNNLVRLC